MDDIVQFITILAEDNSRIADYYNQFKSAVETALRIILLDEKEKYDLKYRSKAFGVILDIIQNDRIDLKDRWGFLIDAIYVSFVSADYDNLNNQLRSSYQKIMESIEQVIDQKKETFEKKYNIDKIEDLQEKHPVVIITSQFLSEEHAPTRSVLDYSYIIQAKMGIPVVIINDSCMNAESHLIRMSYAKEYEAIKQYIYKGEKFTFLQIGEKMPDLGAINQIVDLIKYLDARLVFNVGGYSIVSDLCRKFVKTASIPCSIEFPVSIADYMILPRNIRDEDKSIISTFKTWQIPITTQYNYIYPDEILCGYNRSDFGLSDKAFVIAVVGNRLDAELSEDFLYMLRTLLDRFTEITILFIGEINKTERIKKIVGDNTRVCFAGRISNSGECMKMVDLYMQPRRAGGGRSSFEALYHGVPVISVRYGDVWGTIGDAFCVDNYNEMERKVEDYIMNEEYYNEMSTMARKRAKELEDMEGTFIELFDKLQIAQ